MVIDCLWQGHATPDTPAVGMARLGQPDQLVYSTVKLIFSVLPISSNVPLLASDCIWIFARASNCGLWTAIALSGSLWRFSSP